MWAWLASLIGGPIVTGLIDAYKAKLAAGNTQDKLAADLAARELSVQQAEIAAQAQLRIAEIGHWYEPDHLFGYIMVLYFAKVVVWDVTLGLGSTDPLRGEVATWANLVIVSYFGKRTFENVTRIWKR